MSCLPLIVECAYCHRQFEHPIRPGRRRLYCRRSCRQRAYECRRHLLAPARPHPYDHPTTNDGRVRRRPEWVEGTTRYVFGKLHIVLPGAMDGKGRFPTMCGLQAHPNSARPFSTLRAGACRTCCRLSATRQPTGKLRPHHDLLATQGHLVNIAVELRRADRRSVDEGLPVQTDQLRDLITRSLEPVRQLLLPSLETSPAGDPGPKDRAPWLSSGRPPAQA